MEGKGRQEPYGSKSETGGKYEKILLFAVNEKQWILKRVSR